MRLTAITIPWADMEECTFDLRLGEIRKLEDKTGLGAPVILHHLQTDQWKVDHFRETILQGLLGGGMPIEQARKLVSKWVDGRPARESILPAQAIIMAYILGAPQGKKDPLETDGEATGTAPDDSTSAEFTEPAPPLDSPPELSTA
jgi:hypothetical protein